ncbi:MAG: hypothetical protein NTV43_00410 [Methylococcales bacterium]|nr:hypothetical protein [Methylococcales bacterium]
MNKDEYSDMINEHIDADICYICKEPVNDRDGIHALTGSHWNCHEKRKNMFSNLDQHQACDGERELTLCIANGGRLVHAVDNRSRVALCGHAPKDTAHKMKSREKWLLTNTNLITCKSCIKKHGGNTI